MSKTSFNEIMTVEDSLQSGNVFVNGISDEPAHMDSYMTVIDFNNLMDWIRTETFPIETIKECIEYWLSNTNCGPIAKILAKTLTLWIENEFYSKLKM